jgi:hypothetical protein
MLQPRLLALGTRLLGQRQAMAEYGLLQQKLDCHLPQKSASAIEDCLGGAQKGARSIDIIGDSHTSNHDPRIQEAATKPNRRSQCMLTRISLAGCMDQTDAVHIVLVAKAPGQDMANSFAPTRSLRTLLLFHGIENG